MKSKLTFSNYFDFLNSIIILRSYESEHEELKMMPSCPMENSVVMDKKENTNIQSTTLGNYMILLIKLIYDCF